MCVWTQLSETEMCISFKCKTSEKEESKHRRGEDEGEIATHLLNGNLMLSKIFLCFTVWNTVRVPGTNYLAMDDDMEIY